MCWCNPSAMSEDDVRVARSHGGQAFGIELPGGDLAVFKLTRAATRSDEPNAELWLAPALGWLPARIRLHQDNGDFIDQQWRGSEAP